MPARDEEMDRRIRELHAQGMSTGQIAKTVYLSSSAVYKSMKRQGLKSKRGQPAVKFTDKDIQYMKEMRTCGATLEDIADHFHVSVPTIRKAMRGE